MNKGDLQRIQHINTYCEEIKDFVKRFGNDFNTFTKDRAYFNAVSMCVLQIGELANTLSEEFKEATKDKIAWKQIRGTRNWIAHAYGEVDESILWETVSSDIPVLLRFCNSVLDADSPQPKKQHRSERDDR